MKLTKKIALATVTVLSSAFIATLQPSTANADTTIQVGNDVYATLKYIQYESTLTLNPNGGTMITTDTLVTVTEDSTKVTDTTKPTASQKPSESETSTEETTSPVNDDINIKYLTANVPSKYASVGDSIELSATTNDEIGTLKYRFCVKNQKGALTVIRNYSSSKKVTCKPNKSGTYTIIVYAKDSDGKFEKKSIKNYTVNKKFKIKSFKLSTSSKKIYKNKKVKLNVSVSRVSGKYTYKYAYKKKSNEKIIYI